MCAPDWLLASNIKNKGLNPALTMFVPCNPKNQKNEISNTYSNAIPRPAESFEANVKNGCTTVA